MFCTNCGEKLLDGATFCTNCGEKIVLGENNAQSSDSATQTSDVESKKVVSLAKPRLEPKPEPERTTVVNPQNAFESSASMSAPTPTSTPTEVNAPRTNGLSIASMVLGIVSICLAALQLISFPSGILAIIFSAKTQKSGNKNGMAKAGMITGIIGLVLAVLWLVICIAIGRDIDSFESAAWT